MPMLCDRLEFVVTKVLGVEEVGAEVMLYASAYVGDICYRDIDLGCISDGFTKDMVHWRAPGRGVHD